LLGSHRIHQIRVMRLDVEYKSSFGHRPPSSHKLVARVDHPRSLTDQFHELEEFLRDLHTRVAVTLGGGLGGVPESDRGCEVNTVDEGLTLGSELGQLDNVDFHVCCSPSDRFRGRSAKLWRG